MKKICKECSIEKELSFYYNHPEWFLWTLWSCKECIIKWRKTERERKMARVVDNKRSKKKERIIYSTIRCKKRREENPIKYKAHMFVWNYYKNKNNIRPTECSNCWCDWYIELHHEDYNFPNIIIPLCSACHKSYHIWNIEIDKTKQLILI